MKAKTSVLAVILVLAMIAAVVPTIQGIGVVVDLGSDAPEIMCKCEGPDEDASRPGTQIYPDSDGVTPKTVTICACVCDPNGVDDIVSVNAEVFYPDTSTKVSGVTLTPCESCEACTLYIPEVTRGPEECVCNGVTCQLYSGTFDMAPCDPAGEYRVVLTATDEDENEDKMQNRFFYESIILIEITGPGEVIDFGDVKICEPAYADGWTIHNWGNDPAVVTVSTEGLYQPDGPGVIAPGDLDIAIDELPHDWLTNPVTLDVILECCNIHDLNFSIHVQEGTPSGSYEGDIVFDTVHAPDRTVLFENKDASDDYLYDPILTDTMTGDMTFDIFTGDFTFNGYGLDPNTDYSLIHYSEPWATQGSGKMIVSGTPDGSGDILLIGTLPAGLPSYSDIGDFEYDLAGGKYAKIWLVPSADMTGDKLTGWSPTKILFDIETIETCPT